MRLLQLSHDGTDDNALDLHPLVSVVSGLSAAGLDALRHAVSALPAGADPGLPGLIEAHGVLMALNTDTLAMLDLREAREVVVGAADLGRDASTGPASGPPVTAQHVIDATPDGISADLDRARRSAADAAEAVQVLREAVERARREVEALEARHAELEAQLAGQAAASETPDGPVADPVHVPTGLRSVAERRAEFEARRAEALAAAEQASAGLEELAALDPRPVRVLVEAIQNPQPIEFVPSERGQELADAFVRLQSETAALEQALEADGVGTASALARLQAARDQMAVAEKAMRKPELTDQDRVELEAAHDAVLEADAKGGGRGRKRAEEARAAEQAILDRIGFPSWSAYVMGAALMSIDPAAEQRLVEARAELEAAEEHWANVSAIMESDPVHRDLLDQLEAVYLEAFDLLGGDEPEDFEAALRSLEVPKREISIEELSDALAYQLELVGLPVGEEANVDRVVVIAEAFLDEVGEIGHRMDELDTERDAAMATAAACDDELAALDAEEASQAVVSSATDGDTSVIDLTADGAAEDLADGLDDEARAMLRAELATVAEDLADYRDLVEARVQLMSTAQASADRADRQLQELAVDIAAAVGAVPDSSAAAAAPPSTPDLGGAALGSGVSDAAERTLVAQLTSLRQVSYAGSVPLLLDDPLRGLPEADTRQVLDRIERMADSVQVIYATDDPLVLAWARDAGFERAAAIVAPAAFA
jgi:hypothetical protein